MDDPFRDPQVRAEMACEELRKSVIDVVKNWDQLRSDPELLRDVVECMRTLQQHVLKLPRAA